MIDQEEEEEGFQNTSFNQSLKAYNLADRKCNAIQEPSIMQGIHSINMVRNKCDHIASIPLNEAQDVNEKKGDIIRQGDNKRQKWVWDVIPHKSVNPSKVNITDVTVEQFQQNKQDVSINESRTITQSIFCGIDNYSFNHTQPDHCDTFTQHQRMSVQNPDINDINSSQLKLKAMRRGSKAFSGKASVFQQSTNCKKKRSQRQKTQTINSFTEDEDEYQDEYGRTEQTKRQKRTPHQIWLGGFFKILIFVNRFIYRNKQKLIHFKPEELHDNQIQAINDIASNHQYDRDIKLNKQAQRFHKSSRMIRRIRLQYLIMKKKMKSCIQPIFSFYVKIQSYIKRILEPIPVILPFYKISLFWDIVSIWFILINVFAIPFEICFLNGAMLHINLSISSMIVFSINFLMILNTAYYEDGILQKSRTKILRNFTSKHLFVEFLSFVCLYYNPFGISLLRMFFLIKFSSYYENIQKFIDSLQLSDAQYLIIHLVTLLVEIIFLCHIFACIWFGLGEYQQQFQMTPNWISSYNINSLPVSSQYIESIYFAIVTIGTIGYGDINPKSDIEKGFISVMTLLSCCVFAYIISNIQDIYREYNKKKEDFLKNVTELNRYLISRDVNPNLQQMARKYLQYIHEQNFQRGVAPNQTLNSLSKFLKEEISEEIFRRSVNNISLLKEFSQQFQRALAARMKEITYGKLNRKMFLDKYLTNIFNEQGPDEMILKVGQYQEPALYYIFKGKVEISLEIGNNKASSQLTDTINHKPFYLYTEKQVFGQYEFVSQLHESHINAKSLNVTTIHSITLTDFIQVINQFIVDKEKYFELKDSLYNYQKYSSSQTFCYSCKSSSHLISDCHILFYKPNQQRIINQYLLLQKQAREVIQRPQNRLVLNALAFQYEIEEDCKYFRQDNRKDTESQMLPIEEEEDNDESEMNFESHELQYNFQTGEIAKQTNLLTENQDTLKQKSTINESGIQSPNNFIEDFEKLKQEISFLKQQLSQPMSAKSIQSSYSIQCQETNISEQKVLPKNLTINISQYIPTSRQLQPLNTQTSNISQPIQQSPIQLQQQQQQQLFQQQQSVSLQPQSEARISMKQQFTRKATMKSARMKKNWFSVKKPFDEKIEDVKDERKQSMTQSQQDCNNPQKGQRNSITTLNIVKNVLEQMRLANQNADNRQQSDDSEELVMETIKSFKYYMVNHNINHVIHIYHKYLRMKSLFNKKKLLVNSNF